MRRKKWHFACKCQNLIESFNISTIVVPSTSLFQKYRQITLREFFAFITGVQIHDACESMGLTRRHLYSLITATREVPGGAAFGVRISGPPLLGKFLQTLWN